MFDFFFSLFGSLPTLIVASNSSPLVSSHVDASVAIYMDIFVESIAFDSLGFSPRCA